MAYENAAFAKKIGSRGWEWHASGAAHAVRGGIFAVAAGSDVQSAMTGGFVEGALGDYIEIKTASDPGMGTVAAGFISGTVSEVTGGKFSVGAVTGAMGYLFNQMGSRDFPAPAGVSRNPETLRGIKDYYASAEVRAMIGAGMNVPYPTQDMYLRKGCHRTYREFWILGYFLSNRPGASWFAIGKEFRFGNNFRIAPFGNRTGHPIGRYPHYHRRVTNPDTGVPLDGQGINRYRPVEKKSTDKSFFDRF